MGGSAAGTTARPPALHVIVLGSGGGPQEFNTTAFLVRSTAEGWRRGSLVALDAGVLMGAIARILEQSLPPGLGTSGSDSSASSSPSPDGDGNGNSPAPAPAPSLPYTLTTGPFAGLEVPYASAAANASYVQSALVDTFLITHPHLDHISGFVINTAGVPGTRPKRLAGLPSTIAAFKTHIFNNIIWPNLSDENNGAGLVTYMRLVEGGSPALGDGDDRGYMEISDGLAVKIWSVSHGHCIERHTHRGSGTSTRFGSMDAGLVSPLSVAHHGPTSASFVQPPSSLPLVSQVQQQQQPMPLQHPGTPQLGPQMATPQLGSQVGTPQLGPQRRDSLALLSAAGAGCAAAAAARRGSLSLLPQTSTGEQICVYDSSAYFIRDVKTGCEVLMFGDVEPDSLSLSPRNAHVWQEAAPKIAAGHLAAIFVECSYDNSQPVDRLYGHMTPRFIVEELTNLAAEVRQARVVHRQQQQHAQLLLHQRKHQHAHLHQRDREGRKRKRYGSGDGDDDDRMSISTAAASRATSHGRRKTEPAPTSAPMTTTATANANAEAMSGVQKSEDPVSPRTIKPTLRMTATAPAFIEPPMSPSAPMSAVETESNTPHVTTPTANLALTDPEPDTDVLPPLSAASQELQEPQAPHGPQASQDAQESQEAKETRLPLLGLKVVIIHVKEKLRDGPPTGEIIMDELRAYEGHNPLGCEYILSYPGQSLFF